MGLKELNSILAGLMAMQGFVMLAILLYCEPGTLTRGKKKAAAGTLSPQHYYAAFLLFWALAWSVDFLDWLTVLFAEQWGRHRWSNVILDMSENFFYGAAAYVLARGARFSWNDRYLKTAAALLPAFILLFLIPALFISHDNMVWRLVFDSLDLVLLVAALLALGVGLFRELREPATHVGLIVLIVFAAYALLQLPTSVIGFSDPLGQAPARQILRVLFAMGKIALFFAMVAIVASFYRANLTRGLLNVLRIGSLVMGSAAALLLSYYRLYEAIRTVTNSAVN